MPQTPSARPIAATRQQRSTARLERARVALLLGGGLLAGGVSLAQEPAAPSPRISRYTMTVRLDPAERSLVGTQRITWRNATAAPTSELRFHLYWNAFRDSRSTFMREAGPGFQGWWRDGEFGGIELDRVEWIEGAQRTVLTPEFAQPDDGNPDDRTVVRVALPVAVAPGAEILLETRFRARAPKAYVRAGWIPDDGYFCMQWFPKLGVLQDRDGAAVWNCPQFHANTEFFADFSVYEVTIDVPAAYVVGATGGLPREDEQQNGRRVLRFVAEDVHDFAWVADPDFVERRATFDPFPAANDPTGVASVVARRTGVDVASFDLPKVELRLLLQPEHASEEQARRHFDAARCGIEFYGLRYGAWPYPALTLVDPGRDIDGRTLGGGMEYPMLITCGTSDVLHARTPRPEGVVVHEFGHQYWYGLVANDEFRESWLDEGINSYSEGRAQFLRYQDTMRPLESTRYGMFTAGVVTGATMPADPLVALGVLPLSPLPEAARAWADARHLEGTWLPQSPFTSLLFDQPGLTGFREVRHTDLWNDRRQMLAADNPDAMVLTGWEYLSRESYRANSYTRPATILRTLERQVGRDAWWTFLRGFHQDFRFRHPTTEDFVARLAHELGPDAADLFRRASEAGAVLDYGVHSVSPADGRGTVKSVVVRCYGTLRADIRIRFLFAGREPIWRTWSEDDAVPWREFRFTMDEQGQPYGRLLEVWVDPPAGSPGSGQPFEMAFGPAGVEVLDADLTNNGWRAEPDRRPALYRALRLLMQTQARLTFTAITG